ncbi:MAG: TonB-dependent receptor [Pseudomonadota bacterium]|nr:TonB-dependent receptor [Pseudomonadota bacterium]
MTFALSARFAAPCRPLALAATLFLTFAGAAVAQQVDVPSVLVSGSRFASAPSLAPIGATVITAADIRNAGATDVNQAIRKIGGVFGRQSLDSSPDFTLDLRGFGTNSSQNMVIMVDGVRLNENELATTVLSTIQIDTVERIEITRGGSSVLYGDGATGGVIQIITNRGAAAGTHGAVVAEGGQFGTRTLRGNLTHSFDTFVFDATYGRNSTDNYRDNSRFDLRTLGAGLAWKFDGGKLGIHIDSARQDSRLPGSLTLAQFNANPRQTLTPNDAGALDTDRYTAFYEQRLGAVELAAELSHRERTVTSHYDYGSGFVSDAAYNSHQTQFSPRLRYVAQPYGLQNELVTGIDLIRWTRDTDASFSLANARQVSKAIYVRDEVRFDAAHDGRLAIGARHENFDKDYADTLGFAAPESRSQSQNAWDVQGSYSVLPQVALHAKAGQSYRVANVDENSYRASNDILKGQVSHDLELGLTLGTPQRQLAARMFRHRLTNEIFFDPTIGYGINTNLDPTRRQGVEIDAQMDVLPRVRASAHLQHVNAQFTDGPNAGRDMVLVPKNVVSARLAWLGDKQTADIGAQWVDQQRYGDDFTNACAARIGSYTTFDARYARTFGPWELAVTGANLADRHYFSNAFSCRGGIYPSDGRQLKLSVRYDF